MKSALDDIFEALDQFDRPNLTEHSDAIGWKNEKNN